ncbi:hypothetical protein L7F22_016022 [Adiantum nelumboides]|nr:hypothetical protein [Adiantum nelumboides]
MASVLSSAGLSSTGVDSTTASSKAVCSLGLQNAQAHACSLTFRNTQGHLGAVYCRERFLVSAYKQKRAGELPPGAYEMVDEESGDRVLVFGIEGEEDKVPSDDQLQWEFVENPKRGDISDQAWQRMLQANLPTGRPAYSANSSISGSKSKSKGALPKKSYPDTGDLKSKGLFRRLKVQSLRSNENSGKRRSNKDTLAEDFEVLEDNSYKRDVGKPSAISASQRQEAGAYSVPLREIDEEDSRGVSQGKAAKRYIRGDVTNSRTAVNLEDASIEKVGTRWTRASRVQKSTKEVVAKDFFSIKSFENVGANDKILQALQFMEMRHPSQIQVASRVYVPINAYIFLLLLIAHATYCTLYVYMANIVCYYVLGYLLTS